MIWSIVVWAQPVAAGVIRGVVVDDAGKPVGDAVVQVGAEADEFVALTDAAGRFVVTVPPGTYQVVAATTDGATALGEVIVRHDSLEGEPDEVVVELAFAATSGAVLVQGSLGGGVTSNAEDAIAWHPAEPRLVASPWARPSSVLLWRRDHLGLAALDARGDAARLPTTIDGGRRLPGSPGIAVELLAEPGFVLAAPAVDTPGAIGGAAPLAIRFADRGRQGEARASLGPHGRIAAVAAESLEPGELAMTFGGVVERRLADEGPAGAAFVGQALWATRFEIDRTSGQVLGLLSGGADGSEDYWGDAAIAQQSEDGKRRLTVGVTAAQLVSGEAAASTGRSTSVIGIARFTDVHRFAGRLRVEDDRGAHHLTAGGEVGGGRADGAVHTDVSAYLGDQWARHRTLAVDVGLRWDLRSLGSAQRAAWQPRAAMVWRPDADGLTLTATAERVAAFDDRQVGAWRGGPATVDQLAAHLSGGAWRGRLGWRAGVRARSPDATRWVTPDLGIDGTLEFQVGTALAAQATFSTLEHAATAQLATTVCLGSFAAIARAAPDVIRWGVGFEHSLRGDGTLPLEVGAELFDLEDARQRSAQVTLRRSW